MFESFLELCSRKKTNKPGDLFDKSGEIRGIMMVLCIVLGFEKKGKHENKTE